MSKRLEKPKKLVTKYFDGDNCIEYNLSKSTGSNELLLNFLIP